MTKYLDETGLAHFYDNVQSKIDDSSVFDRNAMLATQSYLGRIFPEFSNGETKPQGMCVIDNETVVVSFSNSNNSNACVLVRANIHTGAIEGTYSTNFAHCNSIAYNPSTEKIYVCPTFDYTNNASRVNDLYVCNSETLAIERVVSFDFNVHSVACDKITNRMYLTSESSVGNVYTITLYEYDPSNGSAVAMGVIPHNIMESSSIIGRSLGTTGAQGVVAYGGEFYFLIGGHMNALVNFDASMSVKSVIDIDPNCFIYTSVEFESVDFTPDGAMIGFSLANNLAAQKVGLISSVHYNGGVFTAYDAYRTRYNYYRFALCDGSNATNYNIYQTGAETAPFATLGEAISLAIANGLAVLVAGEVHFNTPRTDYSPSTISICGNAGASIVLDHKLYLNSPLYLEGNSSTNKLRLSWGGATGSRIPITSYKFITCKNVLFDCANLINYFGRFYGFSYLENCDSTNTAGMYASIIDFQNRGIGLKVNSDAIGIANIASLATS